jgi:tetratricopeptide (TPR) repeat protein
MLEQGGRVVGWVRALKRAGVLGLSAAVGILCAGSAWAWDAPPPQAGVDASGEHYKRGKELYQTGDFDGAIRTWKAAYEISPNAALGYNIARACERVGNAQEAVKYYRLYLEGTPDAADRDTVEADIARLLDLGKRTEREESERNLKQSAADHFKKGRELYQAGRYQEALAELNAAYELLPSSALVYNMAKAREKLSDWVGAVREYRRYLAMDPNAPDKGDVEHVIRVLEERLKTTMNEVTLESQPPGADVYLDGGAQMQGQTPLTLRLIPGSHTLKVAKNGFEMAERDFSMPEDRPLTLTFDLRPLENVGWLTVQSDQDGAHIFLDGTILALTPYKDRRALTAGRHQVILERDGFLRTTQLVDVQKGKESHLKVSMESKESRSKAPLVAAVLLGGGLLGVAAVGAAVSSLFAVRAARSVAETQHWLYAFVAFGVGEAVAGGVGALGVLLAAGLVGLWAGLGFVGRGSSQVTVRPGPSAAALHAPAETPAAPPAPSAAPGAEAPPAATSPTPGAKP